ncbi:MAG: hypothetical protein AB1405_03195 [Bdellovibrionota bacterium]
MSRYELPHEKERREFWEGWGIILAMTAIAAAGGICAWLIGGAP